ncbi:CbtA family protein [Cypionkella sp. TWP1-2-1b2]|uniref:CbtA family protein n=1 Tax=Cypionkella sp. TWP1-2-1b2 TaxID=2804675 RepID=UPI003CED439B
MIQRMLTSAVFAGFAAGLLAALLHFVFVQKLILLGEQYETGALVHFNGVAAGGHADDHYHAAPEASAADVTATAPATTEAPDAAQADGHEHKHEAAEEDGAASRNAWTSLFFGLAYVGYALFLVAGYGLAEVFGKRVTLREGLLWGIAGYAAFQLAPAMGLEPELPGTMAADLTARQIWWIGTALCTAAGLGLLGYGKGVASVIGAVLLLAIPHVIGAPELESYSGVAPPELASTFAARSLGVGLIVWSAMGALSGWLWSRPQ